MDFIIPIASDSTTTARSLKRACSPAEEGGGSWIKKLRSDNAEFDKGGGGDDTNEWLTDYGHKSNVLKTDKASCFAELAKSGRQTELDKVDANFRLRLNRLNEDYDKRLAELEVWRKDSVRSVEKKYSDPHLGIGPISESNRIQITRKWASQDRATKGNGRSACAFIAVCGAASFLSDHIVPMNHDWNYTIDNGAQAWSVWKRITGTESNIIEPFNVFRFPALKKLKEYITIDYEEGGSLDDGWVDIFMDSRKKTDGSKVMHRLKTSLKSFCDTKEMRAGVITIRVNSLLIMRDPKEDGVIWCFDSHSRYDNKSSTLARCQDVDALESFLRKIFPTHRVNSTYLSVNSDQHSSNRFEFTIFKSGK